jgi:biopolymer transport protein ExbD
MLSGEGSVVIQADRESTTGVLIEVMDRLQQAGVEQVAVAASRSAP